MERDNWLRVKWEGLDMFCDVVFVVLDWVLFVCFCIILREDILVRVDIWFKCILIVLVFVEIVYDVWFVVVVIVKFEEVFFCEFVWYIEFGLCFSFDISVRMVYKIY